MEVDTRPPIIEKFMSTPDDDLRLVVSDSDEERELLRSPLPNKTSPGTKTICISELDEKLLLEGSPLADCGAEEVVCNGVNSIKDGDDFRTKSDACPSEPNTASVSEKTNNDSPVHQFSVPASADDSDVKKERSEVILEELGAPMCEVDGSQNADAGKEDSQTDLEPSHGSDYPVVVAATSIPAPPGELTAVQHSVESLEGSNAETDSLVNGSVSEDEFKETTPKSSGVSDLKTAVSDDKCETEEMLDDPKEAMVLEPRFEESVAPVEKELEEPCELKEDQLGEHDAEEREEVDDEKEGITKEIDDSSKDKVVSPADECDMDDTGPDIADDNTMDHMIPRSSMDIDQEEEGEDQEYQGMTDDILPIIESELDDQPPEGEGVFDTEVEEHDDVGLNEIDETQDSSHSIDVADDASRGYDITIDEPERVEDPKKKLMDKFSSKSRPMLKRRASVESAATADKPPRKKSRRQSLDDQPDLADSFDGKQFLKVLEPKDMSPEEKAVSCEPKVEKYRLPLSKQRKDGDVAISFDLPSRASGDSGVESPKVDPFEAESSDSKMDVLDEFKPLDAPIPKEIVGGDALDALFNGKTEITIKRKTFTRILKTYVSQYIMNLGGVAKATRLSLKGEDAIAKMNTAIASYEKQRDDYKAIVKKLIEDREANKRWDEALIPPKMTRSVGLQVCSLGSANIKEAVNQKLQPPRGLSKNALPNPNVAMLAQKQAYEQQRKAQVETQKRQALEQLERIKKRSAPVAKKSTGGSRPMSNASPSDGVTATPRLNGLLKSFPSPKSPLTGPGVAKETPLSEQAVPPNQKTVIINGKTVMVGSPNKPQQKTTSSPAPQKTIQTAQLQRPSVGSVPLRSVGNTVIQTANRNIASGPGRPTPIKTMSPKTPGNPVTPQKSSSGPADATIDLTDDDGPQSSKGNAAVKRPVAASGNPPKILPSTMKPMKHPPLPPNAPNLPHRQLPPKPYLGICNTQQGTQGIMLTWHFNCMVPPRKVVKFQVFAYQESKNSADDNWKKVGDVDALPLPMACTLTQFREGYTYHFIVRAVDEVGTVGPFSAPNTITLMKKTS